MTATPAAALSCFRRACLGTSAGFHHRALAAREDGLETLVAQDVGRGDRRGGFDSGHPDRSL